MGRKCHISDTAHECTDQNSKHRQFWRRYLSPSDFAFPSADLLSSWSFPENNLSSVSSSSTTGRTSGTSAKWSLRRDTDSWGRYFVTESITDIMRCFSKRYPRLSKSFCDARFWSSNGIRRSSLNNPNMFLQILIIVRSCPHISKQTSESRSYQISKALSKCCSQEQIK